MIKLAHPYIPEEAIEKAVEVLKSGNLVQGQYVRKFEEALQTYLKIKHAILVASGTAALHLSLIAGGIKNGDEVIAPAFTFPATVNVIELVGAKPVLVDISLDDFCIDPELIIKSITRRTKAIIPVHEFGQSADMEKILTIAQKYDLKVIEDAACALGTEFNRQKAGTFGDIGCFSFHPRKAITTGEGGAIVTNNDEIAEKLRSLRNHGIKYINGRMDFIYAGFNYRMTDFQAALGLGQLREIDKIINKRIELAKIYKENLQKMEEIKIPMEFPNRKMIYQTYHILFNNKINRDNLIISMKRNGIETNLGAQAIHCLSFFKNKYQYKQDEYPNALISFQHGLALPMGQHIESEIIHISETLKKMVLQ